MNPVMLVIPRFYLGSPIGNVSFCIYNQLTHSCASQSYDICIL